MRSQSTKFCCTVAAAAVLLAACGGDSPQKLLGSAKDYLAKNETNAAVIQLKNVLQKEPTNGEARLLLGRALLTQGDVASAEKELRRALEHGRSQEEVLPSLAPALVRLNQAEVLIKEFGAVQLKDPAAEAELRTAVGDAHRRLGKVEPATTAYQVALTARPGHPQAQLGLAYVAASAGMLDEAGKLADTVIAGSPKFGEAYLLKAQLAMAAGQRDAAKAGLARALEADAGNVEARSMLVTLLIDEKMFDQAAARLDEGRKAGRGSDLRFAFLDALLAYRKGDPKTARERVQQVLKAAPEHVPSLVLLGTLDLGDNSVSTAQSSLQKALALAPDHGGARRLLVGSYLRGGQPARALEALQPMLKSAGDNLEPTLALLAGETYLANGDIKQASAYFSRAEGGDTQRVAAKTRLGQIALAAGRTEAGFKELEAASEMDGGQYQADLALITAHLRKNEPDKAMAAARSLEKKQPNNPLSHQMLGLVSLVRKDADGARKSFGRALELQPTYMPSVVALANLDLAQKKTDDAKRRFEDVIAKDPKIEQAYLGLAEVQSRSGEKPDALAATLDRAIKGAPPAINARLGMVALNLQRKDANAALAAAQAAASAAPDDARVLDALAQAQDAAGQYNQAIESLQKAASLQPKAPQPLARLAALHAKNKELERAIDAQRRAQRLAPDDFALTGALVGYQVAAGRVDDALKESRALQTRQPKRADGFAMEGDVHASQKKWPDAERAYREALKLEPRANAAAIRLHSALAAGGKAGEADALAKKWLGDNPKDAGMRLYLGERALRERNNKAAFGLYNEAVALDPNNVVALNNLAWVAGELGDARAIGFAERAARLAPASPAVLDTYGMLLVAKGDTAKGLEVLEQVRKLAPDQPQLRINYARALIKAGRKDDARTELQALQKLPNDFPGKADIDGLLKSL